MDIKIFSRLVAQSVRFSNVLKDNSKDRLNYSDNYSDDDNQHWTDIWKIDTLTENTTDIKLLVGDETHLVGLSQKNWAHLSLIPKSLKTVIPKIDVQESSEMQVVSGIPREGVCRKTAYNAEEISKLFY